MFIFSLVAAFIATFSHRHTSVCTTKQPIHSHSRDFSEISRYHTKIITLTRADFVTISSYQTKIITTIWADLGEMSRYQTKIIRPNRADFVTISCYQTKITKTVQLQSPRRVMFVFCLLNVKETTFTHAQRLPVGPNYIED